MVSTKWFAEDDDLTDVHAIRRKVFIEEQNVSESDEMDGTDGQALHLAVYDNGKAVATGRVLTDGFVIGRVAVLKAYRGNHYGDLVMRMLIRKAYDMGGHEQVVHAQLGARGFYEKLGFVAFGEEYEEAGIPHINMKHTGDVTGACCS